VPFSLKPHRIHPLFRKNEGVSLKTGVRVSELIEVAAWINITKSEMVIRESFSVISRLLDELRMGRNYGGRCKLFL